MLLTEAEQVSDDAALSGCPGLFVLDHRGQLWAFAGRSQSGVWAEACVAGDHECGFDRDQRGCGNRKIGELWSIEACLHGEDDEVKKRNRDARQ
jgi:hypothetical protein